MPDLSIAWDGIALRGDLVMKNGDLATGDDLQAAVAMSLFTWLGSAWWDVFETRPLGSRLNLLFRAKKSQDTLNRARDYCHEALAWLIVDGVASAVGVTTAWRMNTLLIGITVQRETGPNAQFSYVWDQF